MTDNTVLLSIRNLSVAFRSGGQTSLAVKNVSFDVPPGKTVAVVGESGSGKSVTALSVLRLLPGMASHPSGEVLFDGKQLFELDDRGMMQIRGDDISMIFQEPMTSLNPLHTIERQIGETLLLHKGLTGTAARTKTLELLALVGIPEPENRLRHYPHQLSGGQKQRIMIAMALANEPKLLIADEPTTALDVTVQKQVLELLKSLQEKMGMAILLITHDLTIVRRYADQVVVMRNGEVVERGGCEALFSQPQEPYTRKLLEAEPTGSPDAVPVEAPVILKTNGLNVWFPIKKSLFKRKKSFFKAANQIEIELKQGETLGIVGESGSGKTTTGLALLKLLDSRGDILFDGNPVSDMNQKTFRPFRREMQIVFQDPYGSLSPRMSVADIIGEGLIIHQVGTPGEQEQRIIRALEEVELDPDSRFRFPHEFSGGQRQRIAIARALVMEPRLIVLDEPTSALDRTVQKQVVELLRSIQSRRGISYIFISHDLAVVRALSHRIMVMRDGQIVEQGHCEQIFSSPQDPYTRQLLDAAFFYQQKSS